MIEVAITDVCDFQGGTQPPKSEWSSEEKCGYVRMLQIRDFTQGKKSHIEYVREKKTLKTCMADDILIGRYGASIGKILTGLAGAYNVAIVKTIPDTSKIHREFLLHLLKGESFQRFISTVGSRAAQAGFNKKELASFRFVLPPLSEQKKIAAILDAADQLRKKDQQLIDHYTALSQSLFLEMFGDPVSNPMGWEVGTLDDYCLKITDGTHQSPEFLSEGVPFLLVSNIVKNQIVFDTKKFVSETTYCQLTKSPPIEMGDLLYTSVGSYGNPAIVNTERKFCFQRHIAHLKPDSHKIHFRFLHGLLQSEYVKRQADRLARGVAQKTLNLKAIKSYEVFCPPLSVQMEYSNRVLSIESQQKQSLINSMRSNDLFNSLLQRAFKGELTSSKAA